MNDRPSILMVHNRYDIRGGEDESTDFEYDLLRQRGHKITLLEADNAVIGKDISALRAATSALWSREWYKVILDTLISGSYDILHVQNFFPLISPAVYWAAHSAGVPVIQAVRNYRLVCPSANLFRDGKLCESCIGKKIKLSGIIHKCYRNSFSGTATVSSMSASHHLIGTWKRKVTRYVAISEYVKQQLVRDGFNHNKISVKPNFVPEKWPHTSFARNDRQHILYVGRISQEKGVDVLIDAYQKSKIRVPLKLAGEGSLEEFPTIEGVEFLGRLPLSEVYKLMERAIIVVMPGRWAEPFGRVAIEAFSRGTPVVASSLGGVTEVVQDGSNGFLVQPGNANDFSDRITQIVNDARLWHELSTKALSDYRCMFSADSNYKQLLQIYNAVLQEG